MRLELRGAEPGGGFRVLGNIRLSDGVAVPDEEAARFIASRHPLIPGTTPGRWLGFKDGTAYLRGLVLRLRGTAPYLYGVLVEEADEGIPQPADGARVEADIWGDGAARKRPNPGPAGAGYVIVIEGHDSLEASIPLGIATNNTAEYEAVVRALGKAADEGATEAHLRTDSPVVMGHLMYPHTCKKPHLRALLAAVWEQARRFPGGVTFERIPSKQNRDADRLAKAGRDASER
jgi:ribonuclease HI